MNQVLAPLSLVVLLLGPNALQLHEVGQFFLHREAIAAQLCVNKDVPGSCCAGTCQLAARMGALTGDQPESPMSPASPNPVPAAACASVVADPSKHWSWLNLLEALLGRLRLA
jgi:hypothetical protein